MYGASGNDDLSGGIGNDTLFGGSGANTLDGGEGDDLLYLAGDTFEAGQTTDTATGGAGADTFVLGDFWTQSRGGNLVAPTVITDFNPASGDRLQLGFINAAGNLVQTNTRPVIFRGEMASSLYVEGANLPGADLGPGFTQVWWSRIGTGPTAKTVLVFDMDGDLVLTGADYVVEFAPGTVTSLSINDFVPNSFLNLAGTPGNNVFNGTDGNDRYYGVGGNDTINGNSGADFLRGGTGNDTISGGQGNDDIGGDVGNDILTGDAGTDTLYGGAGNDAVSGGDDADVLYGEDGDDLLQG